MKNRNHVLSIINVKTILHVLFVTYLIGGILNDELSLGNKYLDNITAVVGIGIYIYIRFYIWFKTTYEIKEDAIIFQRFLRLKITKEIMNYSRISSVNASSKLIYRIFNVSKVAITANTSIGNESDSIDIIISNKKYEELKAIIEDNKDKNIVEVPRDEFIEYSYGLLQYFAYTVVIFIPYLFGIVVAVAVIFITREYINVERMFDEELIQEIVTLIVGSSLGVVIKSLFQTRHAINLNVVIYKARSLVNTSSKFISESEIEFDFNRIKVMKIHTFKLFRRCRVGAGVVNSLEVGKEVVSPTLSCLLNDEKTDELLNELGIDNQPVKVYKPKEIRLLYSLISFIGIIGILSIAFAIIYKLLEINVVVYLFFVVVSIIVVFFLFRALAIIKTESCGLNDTQVIISKSYYENIKTIFSYDNIQMASVTQSVIDRIFNVYNVEIGIFKYNKDEDFKFKLKTYSKEDCDSIINYIDSKINDKKLKVEI